MTKHIIDKANDILQAKLTEQEQLDYLEEMAHSLRGIFAIGFILGMALTIVAVIIFFKLHG